MQADKVAVVVNPASADGKTGKRWPEIAAAFTEEGVNFVHTLTKAPGHATEVTSRYLNEGFNLIVSVGGDGTANEVVNGFFSAKAKAKSNAAVSFISTGTGRDFARTLGLPADYQGMIQHIMESPVRKVDVGRIKYINNAGNQEERYFINIAGLGLDGETTDRVNRTSKAFGGFASFLWGTLATLMLYKNKVMNVTVDGNIVLNEPITVLVVGNGRYFGGGMCVAPHAEIDDGLFDIIVLRNLGKLQLIGNLPKVYTGSHLNHPAIDSMRGRKIIISSPDVALMELDGEQVGCAPLEIEILPGALNLKS